MRLVHVVAAISEQAAGPSYSVVRLCESLIERGVSVQLAALAWGPQSVDSSYQRLFPLGFGPRRLGFSPTMRRWLSQEARAGSAQVMHSHGLWMMPNVYPGAACATQRCRLVVSPRGMLSSWALGRHSLQKRLFWRVGQASALNSAACFHATAESEFDDIRRAGFRQPVCVLQNGVDVPPADFVRSANRRQLLYLGRLHPQKGLDLLLHAWAAVQHKCHDWDLVIAGPDNGGYLAKLQSLARELKVKRVIFVGALYGESKLMAYRAASVSVLPTFSENFGMTVAESLAAGTPVIVTRGAPWRGLDEHGAGWWIELGPDPLIRTLNVALSLPPSKLAEMGEAGRRWMIRDYSWQDIAGQFAKVYAWLIDGGQPPNCVRTD